MATVEETYRMSKGARAAFNTGMNTAGPSERIAALSAAPSAPLGNPELLRNALANTGLADAQAARGAQAQPAPAQPTSRLQPFAQPAPAPALTTPTTNPNVAKGILSQQAAAFQRAGGGAPLPPQVGGAVPPAPALSTAAPPAAAKTSLGGKVLKGAGIAGIGLTALDALNKARNGDTGGAISSGIDAALLGGATFGPGIVKPLSIAGLVAKGIYGQMNPSVATNPQMAPGDSQKDMIPTNANPHPVQLTPNQIAAGHKPPVAAPAARPATQPTTIAAVAKQPPRGAPKTARQQPIAVPVSGEDPSAQQADLQNMAAQNPLSFVTYGGGQGGNGTSGALVTYKDGTQGALQTARPADLQQFNRLNAQASQAPVHVIRGMEQSVATPGPGAYREAPKTIADAGQSQQYFAAQAQGEVNAADPIAAKAAESLNVQKSKNEGGLAEAQTHAGAVRYGADKQVEKASEKVTVVLGEEYMAEDGFTKLRRPTRLFDNATQKFIEEPAAAAAKPAHEEGKTYKDAKGNMAIFRNGKFEPVK